MGGCGGIMEDKAIFCHLQKTALRTLSADGSYSCGKQIAVKEYCYETQDRFNDYGAYDAQRRTADYRM